jgi:hypothetical protein
VRRNRRQPWQTNRRGFFDSVFVLVEGIARFIPVLSDGPVVFLTATHNDLAAKTFYWVIVFSFGKLLVLPRTQRGLKNALTRLHA